MKSKIVGEIPRIEKSVRDLYPGLNVQLPLKVGFTNGKGVKEEAPETFGAINQSSTPEELDIVPYGSSTVQVSPVLIELGYCTPFKLPADHYLRNDPIARPHFPELILPGDQRGLPCKHDILEFVEYDLDEQDLGFLGYLVAQFGVPITAEIFETVFSMLELESFKVYLNIKPKGGRPQMIDETQQCVICNEADVDNTNSIVYCDGCDIAVHQVCYGVPFIPEGQWLCRRCKVNPQVNWATCLYCPHISGAFTRTSEGQWAHVLCGLWIPELQMGNPVHMDPIVGTSRIPRDRWRLNCFICQKKQGACIQCAFGDCTTAFHPTCGQAAGLSMTLVHGIPGALADPGSMVAYCSRHTPKDAPVHVDIALARKSLEIEAAEAHTAKNESRNLYPEWRTKKGAIFVPNKIMNTVRDNIKRRFDIDLTLAMPSICRYWTLKRDHVGAMFSKRLVEALDTSQQEYYAAENNAYEFALERKRLDELLRLALKARRNLEGRVRPRR